MIPAAVRRMISLALFVPVFVAVQAVHWIGLLLDEILFPGYREVDVVEPIFVVGLPRSGTSFLQRLLARDEERFTTLRLRELLLAPSVTERRVLAALAAADRALGRPLGRLAAFVEDRATAFMDEVHPVSLDAPEEDHLLLLPRFACFLLVIPFPRLGRIWKLTRFDELPAEEREPLLSFYRACIQRHLYAEGDDRRLLSKNPSFTPFLRSLLETFPDARVICCVRDPARVVPSQLSSIRPAALAFGWDPGEPPHRERFLEMLAHYAEHALNVLDDVPHSRAAVLPLEEMKEDTEAAVLELYARFGWSAGAEFRRRLVEARERSRSHSSGHRYFLEDFNLTADGVRQRFRGLVERFGYGRRREPRREDSTSSSSGADPASSSPARPDS